MARVITLILLLAFATSTLARPIDSSRNLLDVATCTDANCATCSTIDGGVTVTCDTCVAGRYDAANNCASSCIAGCDVCSDATTCTTCLSTHYRNTTEGVNTCIACVNNCGTGTFYDADVCGSVDDATGCVDCIEGCDVCSDDSTCTTCSTGFFLDEVDDTCVACIDHCDVCSNDSTCSTCSAGYFYDGEACVACSAECNTGTYASPFDHGFFYIEGQCGDGVSELPNTLTHINGHNATRHEVSDSGCYSCDAGYCADGWFFVEDACGHDYEEADVAEKIVNLVDSGINNGCFKCAPINGCKNVRCSVLDTRDVELYDKHNVVVNTTTVEGPLTYALASYCEVPYSGWSLVRSSFKEMFFFDGAEYVSIGEKATAVSCNKKLNKNCV